MRRKLVGEPTVTEVLRESPEGPGHTGLYRYCGKQEGGRWYSEVPVLDTTDS